MWDRPNTEFLQSQDLAWEPVAPGAIGSGGGTRRVFSGDASTGAVTELVRFRTQQRGVLPAGADVYVLEGSGTCDGRPYRPGDYLYFASGAAVDLRPRAAATTVYLGAFGPPDLIPAGGGVAVRHERVEDVPWTSPQWSGDTPLEPGAAIKWLRRDERGVVYLSAKLPGWKSPMEEAHPQSEESLKLHGDMLLGTAGVMTPGCYFFHRPGFWHGPLYTRTGTTSLVRVSAPTTTEYREPFSNAEWDDLLSSAYPLAPHPVLR